MSKIISAVPNICEGKDEKLIFEIVDKLKKVKGLILLDVSSDTSRNRTVFSFTGTTDVLMEAGFVLYEETLKRIDMRRHKGSYPRIGAVDVFPFVPLKDVSIAEAVDLSVNFAEKVAERFRIPVYLFAESARFSNRRSIENIRKGEYESLEEKMRSPGWKPDLGPLEFKADSGATIIGARYPLISFKVHMNSNDLATAEIIAGDLDKLPYVNCHAGIDGKSKNIHLVVSITNYRANPMYRVLEAAKTEAKRFGLSVQKVEMIGLIPEIAFVESALYYMNIHRFPMDRLLERTIQNRLAEELFLE